MDKIPASLKYNCSKLMMRTNGFLVRPSGSDSGGQHSIYRFQLPERSLVDLSSLQLTFDANFTGLTTGANYLNIKTPSVYKLIKSVKTYVGGQLASGGQSNHYDLIYHALVRATASEDFCLSRLEAGFPELLSKADDFGDIDVAPTATNKSVHYTHTDLLGLFRSGDQSVVDTSLWGNLEIEISMNSLAGVQRKRGGDGTAVDNVDVAFSNVHCRVNCITQISPLYNEILNVKLSEKGAAIRLPYMNFITNVLSGNNKASIEVNSGCVDSLIFCPLTSTYDASTIIGNAANPSNANANRYIFNSGRVLADANQASLFVSVGSENYPRQPYTNALDVAASTTQAFWGEAADSRNLLYQSISSTASGTAAAQTYSKLNFLSTNFVYAVPFSSSKEGYKTRLLAGLDTASQSIQMSVNQTNLIPANGFAFVAAMTTSMLVYDTDSQSVRVIL